MPWNDLIEMFFVIISTLLLFALASMIQARAAWKTREMNWLFAYSLVETVFNLD